MSVSPSDRHKLHLDMAQSQIPTPSTTQPLEPEGNGRMSASGFASDQSQLRRSTRASSIVTAPNMVKPAADSRVKITKPAKAPGAPSSESGRSTAPLNVKPKKKRNRGLDSSATERTPAVSRQKKKKKIQSSSESEELSVAEKTPNVVKRKKKKSKKKSKSVAAKPNEEDYDYSQDTDSLIDIAPREAKKNKKTNTITSLNSSKSRFGRTATNQTLSLTSNANGVKFSIVHTRHPLEI
ncbi:hypothetical protein PCANC_00743 [Puccinia coronata f. sp. avenae]|uniref:Uncharacterized protein n=1 Tax=Puccinia coronata f. sp. avenae TaxID=200324 RepID=A0A2N5W740_9BASI|nr:hypothetical protein PCANC_00743 [Puccinia coronata f. sp. avenae]